MALDVEVASVQDNQRVQEKISDQFSPRPATITASEDAPWSQSLALVLASGSSL
jgi:hypothetical protein